MSASAAWPFSWVGRLSSRRATRVRQDHSGCRSSATMMPSTRLPRTASEPGGLEALLSACRRSTVRVASSMAAASSSPQTAVGLLACGSAGGGILHGQRLGRALRGPPARR